VKPLTVIHVDKDMSRDAALNAWASKHFKKWNSKLTYRNVEEFIEAGWNDTDFMCRDYCANLAEICTAEVLGAAWEPSKKARSWDVRKDGIFHSVKSIYDPFDNKKYFPYEDNNYNYETLLHPDGGSCTSVWFWELRGVGGYEIDAYCWGMLAPEVCKSIIEKVEYLKYGRKYNFQGVNIKTIKEMAHEQVYASN